ncbi:hypothetical protein ACJJJB_00140 (plasmid) [Microbulbifer sp. ANSA001]|uniref:hypothetical protein n=1 Tax=Microbulbifer sp. ANSA001 TaxID=3243358 RepID=UPI0040422AED
MTIFRFRGYLRSVLMEGSMLVRLLFWLSARLPCRLIPLESGPYLERYYLGQLFGMTFYLHRFVSSDSEKHLHNHPWEWGGSLILNGGYMEERAVDMCPVASSSGCLTEFKYRRWFNRVNANTFHRIHKAEPETWTLFVEGTRVMVGQKRKGWGFFQQLRGFGEGEEGLITVFTPYPRSFGNWWEGARRGGQAGRVPLNG